MKLPESVNPPVSANDADASLQRTDDQVLEIHFETVYGWVSVGS